MVVDSPDKIIALLNAKGIAFSVENGKLKSKAPKGAITPEIVSTIKKNKERLIKFLSTLEVGDPSPIERIEENRDGLYRASSAQKRLWFTQHMEAMEGIYNIPLIINFRRKVDVSALQYALNKIVERHETLRTTFIQRDGAVLQCVGGAREVTIEQYDLSASPEAFEQKSNAVLKALSLKPFDLMNDLMLRCAVVGANDGQARILICLNHIAADGWSVDILFRELIDLYKQYASGAVGELPELPIQYKDFSHWQNKLFQQEAFGLAMEYWTSHLAGMPLEHGVPLDYPRGDVASTAGKNMTIKLDSQLVKGIAALKAEFAVTTFMLMHAAFAVLLSRWSGENDIVLGTPVAGRQNSETKSLIGFFVNTLILRSKPEPDSRFSDFLQESKSRVLQAMSRQVVPFELLVEHFNPERNSQRHPLFQIAFSYTKVLGRALQDIDAELLYPDLGVAKYDLHLQVTEEDSGEIWLNWEYCSDLFHTATLSSLSQSFILLLQGIINNPALSIGEIPIAHVSGRYAAILNRDLQRHNTESPLHDRFSEWANRLPGKTALVFGDKRLSYSELEIRASAIAQSLAEIGVRPGQLVGLYVERSIELIAGILGVLKSGAAYLPLDPANPRERSAFIIDDARVGLILTQREMLERLKEVSSKTIVDIESLEVCQSDTQSAAAQDEQASKSYENIAYVIYTSGSTGRPKGVPIEHSNVNRLFKSAEEYFSFGDEDIWTLFHSFAFDFSVWEVWGALLYGGTLVIVPYSVSRDPQRFSEMLVEQKVTVLNQTPSAFYQLNSYILPKKKKISLRYVIFGGESLEPFRLRNWYESIGEGVELVNMYGITETTVHVTYYKLSQADIDKTRSPIGLPLNDLIGVVCNEKLAIQPQGAAGELLVGGAGVAKYYLNRPELSDERFITLPEFGKGLRFYRSGDWVRMGSDGSLEFIGRGDNQVKLRGFRIELGEIERTLEEMECIDKSLVQLWKDPQGEGQLIAYLESSSDQGELSLPAVRKYLLEKLPDYMAIQRFIVVEAFPITVNGKIDVRRLPSPEVSSLAREEYVAPSTAEEKLMCAIWARVLQCEKVGIDDNFFSIGGDSIRVLQLLDEMENHGLHFLVKDVFANQSIRQLAGKKGLGSKSIDKPAPLELLRMPEVDSRYGDAYPLSSMQRLMVSQQRKNGNGVYTPAHLLKFEDDDVDLDRLEAVLTGLLKQFPVLRTRIIESPDNEALQYIVSPNCAPTNIEKVEVADESALQEKIDQDWIDSKNHVFEYGEQGELYKFTMYKSSVKFAYLLIVAHHAVEDGWGFVRFLQELQRAYYDKAYDFAKVRQENNVFKEHVALELEASRDEGYRLTWQELMKNYTPECAATVCGQDVGEDGFGEEGKKEKAAKVNIETLPCLLGPKDLERLQALAKMCSVPLRTLFIYMFFSALARAFARKSLVIDVVINARSNRLSDAMGAMGLFWNLLPVCFSPSGNIRSDLQVLHGVLLKSEEFSLFPRSEVERMCREYAPAFASFNFVNFHNYTDCATVDEPGMRVERARDYFHHPLKCTVSLAPDQKSLDLWFEYNSVMVSREMTETVAEEYLRALDEVTEQERGCHA